MLCLTVSYSTYRKGRREHVGEGEEDRKEEESYVTTPTPHRQQAPLLPTSA